MRHTIITGATWLALSALVFSAPLSHAGYDYALDPTERQSIYHITSQLDPTERQSIDHTTSQLDPTERQSIDRTTSQLDHNGLPSPDHGPTSTTSPTPIANRHATRQAAPPAPPKPTIEPEDDERRKKEDQKKAEGDGVQASTPPAATVKEENKKTGEIHGGCDEVDLAKPISRRSGRHERGAKGVRTGVRWACLGSH